MQRELVQLIRELNLEHDDTPTRYKDLRKKDGVRVRVSKSNLAVLKARANMYHLTMN